MGLIFKIAWRNILRHKGKSLIIGVILFIGALLMTVGNGVISGMNLGLEENIVNSFMGNIVIMSEKEKSDNILFKLYGESIESFSNYKEIKKVLEKQDYVEKFLPVGKNTAMFINESGGDPAFVFLIGVDLKSYKKMFPDNLKMVEGNMLGDNEEGLMVPLKSRSQIYDQTGIWLLSENSDIVQENLTKEAKENIKDLKTQKSAVFMGMSQTNSTTDIRLGVKGIVRFKALNTIWGHFSIVDIESYRKCLGYFSASDTAADIGKEKKELLSLENENLDDMFKSDSVMVKDAGSSSSKEVDFKKVESVDMKNLDPDAGIFNLVFVKLKTGKEAEVSVEKMNKALSDAKLGVRCVTWNKAAGPIGGMATIIKIALFFFVLFLFFVAVIIIVNTLSMSAIERTPEIGMMRAVGARKSFISMMFLGETSILSGVFGGLGIIVGIIIVKIIPLLNIVSDNDMIQLIYGGDKFQPYLSGGDILTTVLQLAAVTVITVLYPIKVANGITPLDAISRD